MKIQTYDQMTIDILSFTVDPCSILHTGLQTCMKKDTDTGYATNTQIQYLLSAGHMSPLEHVSMTILVKGISRSLLAQITRHRAFKFTASSQHYQNYSDYEMIVAPEMCGSDGVPTTSAQINAFTALNIALEAYDEAIKQGLPKEEARQLLPGACAVNLMITADARNMVNFFRQRRCLRNVEEMVIFADLWWTKAVTWFPELFSHVGAPCFKTNKCNQGKMQSSKCLGVNP